MDLVFNKNLVNSRNTRFHIYMEVFLIFDSRLKCPLIWSIYIFQNWHLLQYFTKRNTLKTICLTWLSWLLTCYASFTCCNKEDYIELLGDTQFYASPYQQKDGPWSQVHQCWDSKHQFSSGWHSWKHPETMRCRKPKMWKRHTFWFDLRINFPLHFFKCR